MTASQTEHKKNGPEPPKGAISAHDAIEALANQPITMAQRVRFLAGFLLCGILWYAPFAAAIGILLPQRFLDDGVGNPTALVAQLNSIGAFVALVANLLWGTLSDRSRSRFGRRSPFMIIGAALAGLFLWLTSVVGSPALIILCWCGAQLFLNMLLAPFLAVLSDRVPENNRASMSAAYGLGVTVGQSVGQIVGAQLIHNLGFGILLSGVLLGVTGLLVVVIWPKEPSAQNLPRTNEGFGSLIKAFTPPTKNCRDFYLALFGRLFMVTSMYMIVNYQLYILQQYIGLDATGSAAVLSVTAVIIMVASLIASAVTGPLSDLIQRRKALVIGAAVIIAIGFLIPAFAPSIWAMYAWSGLYGFGYGVYNACDQALNVDVLPSKAEAGKDLGILNLSNTVGQMAGPVATSIIVMAFDSYQLAFLIGAIVLVVSCVFIALIRKAK
ncbi:MFS transporter [Bifidobacterium vansinderenii]|uniref:Transporter n=1 Tax=Bifidobacterium vansinderenii TaxID=1984871 RepID=A0A229VZY5_9BIFI|nr:MFS transporter [Bifidobacterium vansinderenii]OXN01155.1 transporter [Bifidobacterium vansinderenii]